MSVRPRCLFAGSVGGPFAGGASGGILKILDFDRYYGASGSTPVLLMHAAGARGLHRTLAPEEVGRRMPSANPLRPSFLSIRPFAEHVIESLPGNIRSTKDLPNLAITAALVNAEFSTQVDKQPAYYVVLDASIDMSLAKALAATCACPPVKPIPIENQTLTLVTSNSNGTKNYERVHVINGLLLDPGMIEKIPLTPILLDAKEGDVIFVMDLGITRIKDKKLIEILESIVNNEYFEKLSRTFAPFAYLKFIFLDIINSHYFDLEAFRKQALGRNIGFIEISINAGKKSEHAKSLNLTTLATAIAALASALKTFQELHRQKEKRTREKILNPNVIIPAVTTLIIGYKALKEVLAALEHTPFDRRNTFDHRQILPAFDEGVKAANGALETFNMLLESRKLTGEET